MKVLECQLCGSLFKSTDGHISVFGGNNAKNVKNYCTRCSTFIFTYGFEGLNKILEIENNAELEDNGN